MFGIASDFIDPIRNVQYKNYQIIINGVNEIQCYAIAGLKNDVVQEGMNIKSCLD
jgi:hypothetical protein